MSSLGLKRASVASWRGMLWVHPDENATSVENWFGGVEPRLGPHKVDELVEYKSGRTEYTVAANWKIVVENYIDSYHLAHLHSGTLSMYDHRRSESGFAGPHFYFWEPLSPEYAANVEKNASSPLVIPVDQAGAWVPMLFPGIGLAENEDSWSVFHLTPLAPDRTRVVVRTKLADTSLLAFASQSIRSFNFWTKRVRGKYDSDDADDPMASGDFMQEDIYACEQQQRSLKSPYFEHGPSSVDGEAGVRQHQELVIAWLEEEYVQWSVVCGDH